jgi:ubiquinone/menaquinone biosynthesis C-methylase UbiE
MSSLQNNIAKEQFNKQAKNFANWQIGKNTEYLQAFYNFCNIQHHDKVLDVACGPGEFTIFIAKRVLKAQGIDISDKEIEIAKGLAHQFGLENVTFDCADVENLPYTDKSFSVVLCKSAFHHFTNPDLIFNEMIRCCQKEGRISIQDIVAYEDNYINDYFEAFDKLVDISHNKTLSKSEFDTLYSSYNIRKTGEFRLTVDLNVDEYIEHAKQSERNKIKIREHLVKGENDKRLTDYLFYKKGKLYFKRPVYLVIGRK